VKMTGEEGRSDASKHESDHMNDCGVMGLRN
jgi:hypothetical protein